MLINKRLLMASTALVIIIPAGPALAQDAGSHVNAGLEDIVVTAQRREERLQDAAVAVTALSGEAVERSGVTELANLANLAPAVQIARTSGPYNSITLRGVSSTVLNQFGDPAVAVNVDQIYQARSTGGIGQFFDIARVEVVKGPQGILYGRNATGGAINIITNGPVLDEFSGYAGVDIGNYNQIIANGAVNVPLGSTLAARLAFQSEHRDGFFSNDSADANINGFRAQLRWEPNDRIDLTIRGDYTKDDNRGVGATAWCAGAPASVLPAYANCATTGQFFGNPWTSIVDQQPAINPFYPTGPGGTPGLVDTFSHNRYYSVSAELNWRVLGGTLTLIPAFHRDKLDYFYSIGWNLREQIDHNQYTFEARYASNQSKPISYVLGAYYFNDKQDGGSTYDQRFFLTPFSNPSSTALGFPAGTPLFQPLGNGVFVNRNIVDIQNPSNKGTSWALFGNVRWSITDNLRLSAGVRYSREKKSTFSQSASADASGPDSPYLGVNRTWASPVPRLTAADVAATGGFSTIGSDTWDNTSYRLGVEWNWRTDSLLYAQVATGFKSGGFFLNDSTDALGSTYDPEKVTAYTIGSKNEFFGNRLRLNVELFRYEYSNQQVGALLNNTRGKVTFATLNVGESTIQGAEIEAAVRPFKNTSVTTAIQYLDAVYDSFLVPNAFLGPAGNAASRCRPVANTTQYPGAAFANDCSGQQMVATPKWTVNFGIQQVFPLSNGGSFVAELNTRWEDEREVNASYFIYSRIASNTRTDASLTYNAPNDRWSLTGYIRNIENDAIVESLTTALNQSGMIGANLRPPRQYGVRLRARFGR